MSEGGSAERSQQVVLLALDPEHFRLENARQVLEPGQKHPENPVLRPRPGEWDGTRCKVYGTVLFDPEDGLSKMWYSGGADYPDAVRRREGSPRHIGYACSTDGVHWERPVLGLIEYNGSRENNLLHLDAQAPCVFLQTGESDPNRRFLMITEAGLDTARNKVLYSPDGIRWARAEGEPIASRTGRGTHEPFSILYDPADPDPQRLWKGYSLLHASDPKGGYRGRAVGLFFAPHPQQWTEYPVQPIQSARDGMESEIHIPHVTRFYDTYVMLYDAMEPNHHTQTEVAVSGDGVHFRRVQNGVKLIPNGRPGEPDAGKVCVSPRSLFEHDGRIWWYYTISTDTYQTGPRNLRAWPWYRYTGLAQWRQDGFASLRPASTADVGVITSAPLQVGTEGLGPIWLNAVAPLEGSGIKVELLGDGGQVLATAQPWFGDRLRGAVEWQNPLPTFRAGQEIALRLTLSGVDARLYALGVRGALRSQAQPAKAWAVQSAPPDPRVRWRFQAETKISGSPCLAGDTVYVGSWDQWLYALDARSGALRWRVETGNAITTGPVSHGGIVYVGSRDGNLHALDGATGQVRWKVPVGTRRGGSAVGVNGPWIDGAPAIGAWTCRWGDEKEAPQRLFVGSHSRNLLAFDLQNGTEEWRFPTFNWILSRPAIADYAVFFGSLDGHIYALDARCGALLWRFQAGRQLRYAESVARGSVACEGVCGSPLVAAGTVYCGADDGFLYALAAASGQERWTFQTDKWIWGRPLLVDGVLVVASADGRVYGLEASSGRPLWRVGTENGNYADVVSWRGLALVACTSGRLYALEPQTGKVAWTFLADAGLRAAPAVDDEGLIYLPTCGGTLYGLAP